MPIIIFHRVSYVFEELKCKQVIFCFCFWEWEWKVQRSCRKKITVKGVLEEKFISYLALLFTLRIFVFPETTCPRLSQKNYSEIYACLCSPQLFLCVFFFIIHTVTSLPLFLSFLLFPLPIKLKSYINHLHFSASWAWNIFILNLVYASCDNSFYMSPWVDHRWPDTWFKQYFGVCLQRCFEKRWASELMSWVKWATLPSVGGQSSSALRV